MDYGRRIYEDYKLFEMSILPGKSTKAAKIKDVKNEG